MQKRAAIYVRVSTDKQTIENQVAALRQIAERRGWQVVEQYHDADISGAKGRDGPSLSLASRAHLKHSSAIARYSVAVFMESPSPHCKVQPTNG